jgi:hypothetical protein
VSDTSEVQSNVIESCVDVVWGVQRGESAMMTIVETPDDAAYQFEHPAGGADGDRAEMAGVAGEAGVSADVRMCFFAKGNYVDMAKRYRRRHVIGQRDVRVAGGRRSRGKPNREGADRDAAESRGDSDRTSLPTVCATARRTRRRTIG